MDNRFKLVTTVLLAFLAGQCLTGSIPLRVGAESEGAGENADRRAGGRAGGRFRERLREKLGTRKIGDCAKFHIAGLDVAAWKPAAAGKAPLVIFSHGFGGGKTQSASIMKAMADAGYLVIAPDHRDANGSPDTHYRPQASFNKVNQWSDKTYIDRHDDIVNLIAALHADPTWNSQSDWTKLALCGHSLGGYTVLGLAGAWPSWKIPGIKAVIALSPYTLPYTANRMAALDNLQTPVMYQGGTKDFGITPFVKKPGGAYSKTSSPACFVEFDQFNHFSWTNFNRDADKQNETNYYCVAFLDRYLKGDDGGRMGKKLPGVVAFEAK